MMAKKLEDRFQTPGEVAEALEPFMRAPRDTYIGPLPANRDDPADFHLSANATGNPTSAFEAATPAQPSNSHYEATVDLPGTSMPSPLPKAIPKDDGTLPIPSQDDEDDEEDERPTRKTTG